MEVPIWCLTNIKIFCKFTDADFYTLHRSAKLAEYRRREQVTGKTDVGDTVYLLKEGRIKIYKLQPNGEGLTLEVLESGDIFGESKNVDDEARDTIAETLDDSLLHVMRRRDFELLLKKNPDLTTRLAKFSCTHRRRIQNHLENLAFRTASSRLARLLLSLADRGGVHNSNGMQLRSKLSRSDLAKLTGTTRETTSDLLNELERLSIIEVQGRRIRILNQWKLKKIADAKMEELEIPPDEEEEPNLFELPSNNLAPPTEQKIAN
ncbi:MAG: Crp/Fnr family transcriptional regulator [Candidatus Poribacteria bacterium]|nr:Crp/Fnr family transcriptional regulator [Candidatus Poribacteria bacterium]